MDIEKKTKKEKEIIEYMIKYYCKKKHNSKITCDECNQLINYAFTRIEKCPFKETKTFCSACKVHCYQKEMKEKIQSVMRFSGPRMIFHKPIPALHHMLITLKR